MESLEYYELIYSDLHPISVPPLLKLLSTLRKDFSHATAGRVKKDKI